MKNNMSVWGLDVSDGEKGFRGHVRPHGDGE